jgi:L-arabinonolactonase
MQPGGEDNRVAALTPIEVLKVGNILGEGILWDQRRAALWWTDIQGRRLYRYDWTRKTVQRLDTPERVGSFGLVHDSEELIVAFASGVALYDPYRCTVEWLARPADVRPGVRFNDGRVDRRGRFWCGTMAEGGRRDPQGALYSIGAGGALHCHLRDIHISNSLCMSPDGARLYFADSPTRTIKVYGMIEPDGRLGEPEVFVCTPHGAYPDGATVDAEGCVWSAHWGAGRLVRYTPGGEIDRVLQVPTCQPSCVCLAGPELDVLCVTTAREGLDAATLDAEPGAGDVFLFRAGVQGLPESEYRP